MCKFCGSSSRGRKENEAEGITVTFRASRKDAHEGITFSNCTVAALQVLVLVITPA